MAKKFQNNDLIHNLVSSAPSPAQVQTTTAVTTSQTAAADEKMRTSYIVSKQANFKMKYIALKQGKTISELVDEALNNLIAEWEKQTGESTPSL